jgi:hypothetical protein
MSLSPESEIRDIYEITDEEKRPVMCVKGTNQILLCSISQSYNLKAIHNNLESNLHGVGRSQ